MIKIICRINIVEVWNVLAASEVIFIDEGKGVVSEWMLICLRVE